MLACSSLRSSGAAICINTTSVAARADAPSRSIPFRLPLRVSRGNEVGVIADDVTGANPFGAPPDGIFVAPFEQGEIWWLKSR
jgi:hypothetical protein